jgi:trigger factor
MQVTIETVQGLERKMTVSMPADGINAQVEKKLKDMAKRVKMDGFRPGKVPFNVVKSRYGAGVREEAMYEQAYQSFWDAAQKESVRPAGMPRFESVEPKGEAIEFVVNFDVYPEIKLANLEDLAFEIITSEVTDADVDAMLTKLQSQQKSYTAKDGAAEKGDRVMIDFAGKLDGEVFEGGAAQNVPLVLGSGQMIPGFEDGLMGKKAGDKVELNLTFPEQYHAEKLAGKAVVFEVTVNAVEAEHLPELTEDFIKGFGVASGQLADLKTEIKGNMTRELKHQVETKNKSAMMDALLAANSFEVPAGLIEQETHSMVESMKQRFKAQGMNPDQFPIQANMFKDEAERRVKLGLLMSELIKSMDVKLDAAKLESTIEDMAASYEDPAEVREYYKKNAERMRDLEALVLENQVTEALIAKAKTTSVAKAFDEMVNQGR